MSELQLHITKHCWNLDSAVGNSKHSWSQRKSLIVRIYDETGAVGLGEAAPLPGYSPETIEESEDTLQRLTLRAGQTLSLSTITELVSNIPQTLPSARFAVESALLDLLARKNRQSISELLGSSIQCINRCALIAPLDYKASIAHILKRGIGCGKLKIGKDWPKDFDKIKNIRNHDPDFTLRLDVNGGWTLTEARARLALLESFNIQFIEQPVAPPDMHGLVASPVPLAADESMHSQPTREMLGALWGDPALVAIVLKPTLVGGILACLKLHQRAKEEGIQSIASHSFEGPIGTAGVAELALTIQGRLAAGLDEHAALPANSDILIPQLQGTGIQRQHAGLGLLCPT